MTLGSDATGDVYYRDASGFLERLGASTDGYVLTTGGAGTVPAWEAVPAGTTLSGSTNNELVTVTGADAIQGESGLLFDGTFLNTTAGVGAVIGHTAQLTVQSGTVSELQVLGDTLGEGSMVVGRFQNNSGAPALLGLKSRGAVGSTPDENTIVQDDDNIFSIHGHCDDGTDYASICAEIFMSVDDTPGANDTPGRITFNTTADGAATSTERMRIDSAGDVTVSTGNLIIGTSGKGIDFSATADAGGMTSEVLDDYEEGTFTPIVKYSTSSYALNWEEAEYVKIGNLVYFQIGVDVDTSASNDSSTVYVYGLPYTSDSSTASHVRYFAAWEYNSGGPVGTFYLNVNNTYLTSYTQKQDGNAPAHIESSQVYRASGGNQLFMAGTYMAA
jgi:hypothetical protein